MPLPLQAGLSNAAAATVLALLAYLAVRLRIRPAAAHALWLLALVKLLTPPLLPVQVAAVREDRPEPVRVTVRVPKPVKVEAEPDYPPAAVEVPAASYDDPATRGMIDPKTGLPLPPNAKRQAKTSAKEPTELRPAPNQSAEPETAAETEEIEYVQVSPPEREWSPWWGLLA